MNYRGLAGVFVQILGAVAFGIACGLVVKYGIRFVIEIFN
jgi:hypothetical protein